MILQGPQFDLNTDFPYSKPLRFMYDYGRDMQARLIQDGGDFSRMQFVLGPAMSYLAITPNYGIRHGPDDFDGTRSDPDIHPELYRHLLQELKQSNNLPENDPRKIRRATIGYLSSFVLQSADGKVRWRIAHGLYPGLNELLLDHTNGGSTINVCDISDR